VYFSNTPLFCTYYRNLLNSKGGKILSIFTRFQKNCETKDNHSDEQLKTHYYKGTFNQIFDIVENLIRQDSRYVMEHVSKEHGEISVKLKGGKPCFYIITLVAVKPLEIAVDIHISTESFSLFGSYPSLRNEIVIFYQKLNKIATLLSTGRNV
jgi:hypothetical protein